MQLGAMLTDRTVRARVTVASWQDAAEAVGRLLVDDGAIEPRYIEAMVGVLRDMGPYAVIAPGIVLLHARPEDGVRRPCLGLITLSPPVPFGHSENDPVDIVIALGAVDKQAHIEALQGLALLLSDTAALQRIRAADDDNALLAAVTTGDEAPTP
ncbi:MAG: PTS sugar transporter subunit IIA [Thiobacillaceae bacterium]